MTIKIGNQSLADKYPFVVGAWHAVPLRGLIVLPNLLVKSHQALAEVRRIVLEVIGSENATLYLFGSWAQGNATRTSDIDVAIDPREPLPRGTLARLRKRLEESHVPYRVDVVDLRRTAPEFRRRVLTEGIPWND